MTTIQHNRSLTPRIGSVPTLALEHQVVASRPWNMPRYWGNPTRHAKSKPTTNKSGMDLKREPGKGWVPGPAIRPATLKAELIYSPDDLKDRGQSTGSDE
jgi:hypothetical protein